MLCHFRCSFAIPAFALHIWAAGTSAQTTVITGLTVELNGVAYHLPPQPVGRLVGWESNATATNELDIRPITVISSDIDRLTAERLRDLSTDFSRSDDVFQDAFLEGIPVLWASNLRVRAQRSSKFQQPLASAIR